MAFLNVICMLFAFLEVNAINGPPLVGYFELNDLKSEYPSAFLMYKGSHIEVKIRCQGDESVSWVLKKSDCLNVLQHIDNTPRINWCNPDDRSTLPDSNSTYISEVQECNNYGNLKDESCNILRQFLDMDDVPDDCKDKDPDDDKKTSEAETDKKLNVKRSSPDTGGTAAKAGAGETTPAANTKAKNKLHSHRIAVAWDDGVYELYLCFPRTGFNATLEIRNKQGQYLAATDWPLLPFFGVMCGIYIILGLAWLVLMMLHWRNLHRLQFWIGVVILLGMIEKAVLLAEYEHLNIHGTSVRGVLIFAEMVSCLKRTLFRILVIIVSLGFGIVKPRLGPMFNIVVIIGVTYFVLAFVERCINIYNVTTYFKLSLFILMPLTGCDFLIYLWIVISLITTMRKLKLRCDVVKLSLYRHFTNTLIFTVLASLFFMVWSTSEHKLPTCISDWKEMWVDDAVWHLLSSIILVVIMILFRPSANCQQYANSPLLDQDDDESTEPMMNDAFEGMKMPGGEGHI